MRSILEYCSQIWNPYYHCHKNRIENIQRKFLRYLEYKCNHYEDSYESKCKRFHILPLNERRRIDDIVLMLKIAQNKIDSSHLLAKINFKVPIRSVRLWFTRLHIPLSSTNYRQNSFFIRTAHHVNKLDDYPEFDLFNLSPNSFKARMTRDWFGATP